MNLLPDLLTIAVVGAVAVVVFAVAFRTLFRETSQAIVQALADRDTAHRREAELRDMILQLHTQLLEMSRPPAPSVQTVPPGYRIATPSEQAALRRPARPPNTDADDAEDFNFYPGGGQDIPRPVTTPGKVRSIRDVPVPFGAEAFEELARQTQARIAEEEKRNAPAARADGE